MTVYLLCYRLTYGLNGWPRSVALRTGRTDERTAKKEEDSAFSLFFRTISLSLFNASFHLPMATVLRKNVQLVSSEIALASLQKGPPCLLSCLHECLTVTKSPQFQNSLTELGGKKEIFLLSPALKMREGSDRFSLAGL